MKLNIKAFALACAIIWAFGVFFMTWWLIAFEGTTHEPTFLGQIYRGYNISPLGSIIGSIWGFFDAGIGGAVLAWLYNRICDCGCCCCCKNEEKKETPAT